MENFDYSETLSKLNKEKETALLKLKAIDMAIEAITQLSSNKFFIYYGNTIEANALNSPKAIPKRNFYEDYEIEVPNEYESDLPLIEKLIYALAEKNGAFAHEAAEYIFSIDQTEKLEYLKTRFTDIASGLGRANKLKIKKIGKKYKYMIKEEDYLSLL